MITIRLPDVETSSVEEPKDPEEIEFNNKKQKYFEQLRSEMAEKFSVENVEENRLTALMRLRVLGKALKIESLMDKLEHDLLKGDKSRKEINNILAKSGMDLSSPKHEKERADLALFYIEEYASDSDLAKPAKFEGGEIVRKQDQENRPEGEERNVVEKLTETMAQQSFGILPDYFQYQIDILVRNEIDPPEVSQKA